MKALVSTTLALFLGLSATATMAGELLQNSGNAMTVVAASPVDSFKAVAGGKPLHCTSSGQHHTCTSDYAFVCPEGWSACSLSGKTKTCCTK
jgi:hypothetical protein